MAARTWSNVFASGAATPALLVGNQTLRWAPLLARLIGMPGAERRVLMVASDSHERQRVLEELPLGLHPRVPVITEKQALSCHSRGVDVVLWLSSAGRFDEETKTHDDVCSEHDEEILLCLPDALGPSAPRNAGLYVATFNPMHAALPGCLVPERMDGMDAELRVAVATQFNIWFEDPLAFALYMHLRPTVVAYGFDLKCPMDGVYALEHAAEITDSASEDGP